MTDQSIPQQPVIDKVGKHESKQLADILSDSFMDDPVMNWLIPDTDLYPAFYRMLIDTLFVHHNHMYMDRDGRGAALWLPPGVNFHIPMGFSQLWLVLRLVMRRGVGIFERLKEVETATGRHHPTIAHYYLQSLGARREFQGQGIGSSLMKAVLPRCDTQNVAVYLESSNEKNVPLYQRHGFEVIAQETLAGDGPSMWFMLREPQPVQ